MRPDAPDPHRDLHLLIDGERIHAASGGSAPVCNPATGETIGELPLAGAREIDRAIAAAARAFPAWRATSAYDRGLILRRAGGLIRARIERIATAMVREQGKPIGEARGELLGAAEASEWQAEEGRRAYGRIIPHRVPGMRASVFREPVGPVAGFTPWNFPAGMANRKIATALAAGCTIVIKPAEETPASALLIAQCYQDAGLPPGVLNLLFGDPETVSTRLIRAREIRKISFTGSVVVGRRIAALASEGVKRVTMELGGHAPTIIFDDADLEAVVAQSVAAKFRNAGQVCIAPTRFLVQDALFDQFVEQLASAAGRLVVGDGLDPATQMGPLANPRRVEALDRILADARERGTRVIGGGRIGNVGNFWRPAIVVGPEPDSLLMTQEPFGPIAAVSRFAAFDDALAAANALSFGLAAYAFTRDGSRQLALAERVEAGMIGINSFQVGMAEAPFGGIKESGYGSEGGQEGVDAHLVTKFVNQV